MILSVLYEKFESGMQSLLGNTGQTYTFKQYISVPKGSYIICPNYHVVAITNRDIYKYSTGYASAFDYLDHQPVPTKGQMQNPTCYCGAAWFRNKGSTLVMKPVLMEKDDEKYKTECI